MHPWIVSDSDHSQAAVRRHSLQHPLLQSRINRYLFENYRFTLTSMFIAASNLGSHLQVAKRPNKDAIRRLSTKN